MSKINFRRYKLKTLQGYLDKDDLVKIVTGVRRCGKSYLLAQLKDFLLAEKKVNEDRIIYINFELLEFEYLLDYKALNEHIVKRLIGGETIYVFLDEIQLVPHYERVVNSLRATGGVDLYISGSNSSLLSGEVATLLSGRGQPTHLLPFSFYEFVVAKMSKLLNLDYNKIKIDKDFFNKWYQQIVALFLEYKVYGGFPQLLSLDSSQYIEYLQDNIYNTVIVRDILQRRPELDVNILKSILRFIYDNTGSEISIKRIQDTLTSSGRKIAHATVDKYLNALSETYIIYECKQFNVKGLTHLKTNSKYYAVDTGLRGAILSKREFDEGRILENIVYLELLRRGYSVSVGKLYNRDGTSIEIDFCATKKGIMEYFQVTTSMLDEKVKQRELRSLEALKDNYRKTIITADSITSNSNHNGIEIVHILDWLLGTSITY